MSEPSPQRHIWVSLPWAPLSLLPTNFLQVELAVAGRAFGCVYILLLHDQAPSACRHFLGLLLDLDRSPRFISIARRSLVAGSLHALLPSPKDPGEICSRPPSTRSPTPPRCSFSKPIPGPGHCHLGPRPATSLGFPLHSPQRSTTIIITLRHWHCSLWQRGPPACLPYLWFWDRLTQGQCHCQPVRSVVS